jgi:hypothetical protein
VVLGDGGGTRVDSRILVVEAHGRVVTDHGMVREGRWVAEGQVGDYRDSGSRVKRLCHLGDFGSCSKDRESGVDGWVRDGDFNACGCLACKSETNGAI